MKQLSILLLSLISMAACAQSFEGTITWKINYQLADPQKQAEMEKNQKSLSDPANQEKMKKMQEQMNTPEMKAMMEKNPQMKAQMENAMKMIQGGGAGSMMPKSFIVKSKGGSALTKMEGGMMNTEMLYLPEKKQSFMLDRTAKTYSALPQHTDDGKRDSIQHKVVKTGETMKILNYTCTKYIVELTSEHGAVMKQVFWTTSEIKGLDMKSLTKQRMGNGNQSLYYEGIDGVPLRMEMSSAQMNMEMEVTDIKRESLPAADFTIPADFKETKSPHTK